MNPFPRFTRLLATSALIGGIASFGITASSHADAPLDIEGPITDRAGALGARTGEVEEALRAYADETGYQLFVVFVPTFDGMDGADWADETAFESNIRIADTLLAVATEERAYGLAIDENGPISDDEAARIENDFLLPELRDSDWAGAAIATVEGLTDAQGGNMPWGWIAGGGAAAVGVGAYAVHRVRRRYDHTHVVRDEHGQPIDPLSTLDRDELDQRRGTALVGADDALASSEQELSFAEAQFGKEATRPFADALARARELTQKAFALQQRLDDHEPEDDALHRKLSIECIRLCDEADALLDAQVEEFDRLRDMQARAPEVLADMAGRADEVTARIPASRAQLEALTTTHSATDLASVAGNADQAEQLIVQAKQQCAEGQAALTADDRAKAVVHAKAAEAAVGQATTLLNAIDRADQDLAAAPAKIDERVASLRQDIDDAARLASTDAAITAEVAKAQEAIAYAGSDRRDPLAALASLQTVEARLDELLEPVRAEAAEAERARVALGEAMTRAASRVTAITEFIETRRGAVGTEARTRLSEASRHLTKAQQSAETDPSGALETLVKVNDLVDEAERLARTDVDGWERRQNRGGDSMVLGGILGGGGGRSGGGAGGAWAGGWGGGSRSRSSSSSSTRRRSRTRSSSRSRSSSGRSRRSSRSRGGRF